MEIEKEKVIERIKKAKSYGLKYSELARSVGLPYASVYCFINGTYNMSKDKQISLLLYVETYIEKINKQLKIIKSKELCTQ